MSVERPKWVDKPTPNTSPRKLTVKLIVLHHTGGKMPGDLNWLTNRASRVSSDFLVTKDGTIYKLNPQITKTFTWHAGLSTWNGRINVNRFSVGIEQEHKPGEEWTDAQIEAVAHLCAFLKDHLGTIEGIESHAAVAIDKEGHHGRKTDPENFPWEKFHERVKHYMDAA